MKVTVIPIVINILGRSQRLGNKIGRVRNQRINRDYLNYNIVEIVQNTEKSPEDRRRLAVTHTLVKDH